MKNRKLNDLAGKYLKMLVYGRAGSGKTFLTYSASIDPRTAPVLAIDCIGNAGSAFGMAKDVTIVQLDNIKDLNLIYDFLSKDQPANHPFRIAVGIKNDVKYKTLIVDSLTELQTMMLNGILNTSNLNIGDLRPNAQIQHFGSLLGQTLNITKLLVDLHLHVLFTALEDEDKNEQGVVVKYDILLATKAKVQVAGIMHTVGRVVTYNKFPKAHDEELKKEAIRLGIKLKPDTNIVMFAPIGNFEAKDQGKEQLPKFIILPTITDILDVRNYKEI